MSLSMKYLYQNIFNPVLYSNPYITTFIKEAVSKPNDVYSDELAIEFCETMPSLDDMLMSLKTISDDACQQIKEQGLLSCFFVAGTQPQHTFIRSQIPVKIDNIRNLLNAGKCLAFVGRSRWIFFVIETYLINGIPVIGRPIPAEADWGIHIIGSSARGNSIQSIVTIQSKNNELIFTKPKINIVREKSTTFPFARFFHIQDEQEIANILLQLPQILEKHQEIKRQDAEINMLTVMKSLLKLGYNH